jgi:hypothetical protein
VGQKNGGAFGAAKFREETSKKAESDRSRLAALHNLWISASGCKHFFATQHFIARSPTKASLTPG